MPNPRGWRTRTLLPMSIVVWSLCGACNPKTARPAGQVDKSSAGPVGDGQLCASDTSPVRLSSDSIGMFPISATLRALRTACPAARDTTIETIESHLYAGISLPFRDVQVVAVQYRDSLKDDRPPNVWIIAGRRARLPDGLPLTATWRQLSAAYGEHIGDQEGEVYVMFCRMPNFFFTLEVPAQAGGPITDWSVIPDETGIKEVRVYLVPPANWSC